MNFQIVFYKIHCHSCLFDKLILIWPELALHLLGLLFFSYLRQISSEKMSDLQAHKALFCNMLCSCVLMFFFSSCKCFPRNRDARVQMVNIACGFYVCFKWWVEGKALTEPAVELTCLGQLTEMSATSNSGYFVCLLWKGCLNGSLVTNSTWRLTSIYSHFLSSRVLHSCLPPWARVQRLYLSVMDTGFLTV